MMAEKTALTTVPPERLHFSFYVGLGKKINRPCAGNVPGKVEFPEAHWVWAGEDVEASEMGGGPQLVRVLPEQVSWVRVILLALLSYARR